MQFAWGVGLSTIDGHTAATANINLNTDCSDRMLSRRGSWN